MYSHKRSFTGQSSRSLAALLDPPFLLFGVIISGLFAVAHSAATFFKLHDHVRAWPTSLEQIPIHQLSETLRRNAHLFDYQLIITTWIGLVLPMLVFAIAIRWTLASLRISVQRLVIAGSLTAFYICSFLSIALANPEWTPGNRLVQLFEFIGPSFFQSLRALIGLTLVVACAVTLSKNATSRFNRNIRWTVALLIVLALISFDYIGSQNQRKVDESYLKSPPSVRFMFVVPGLRPIDLQKSLRSEEINELRNQLSSFQEVHPSTPSLLGQFVTTLLGLEPNIHGVRHDFIEAEILAPIWNALAAKSFPKGHSVIAMSIGGPSPLESLVGQDTHGKRCGQTPAQLAKLGQFQASVIPYALTPRFLEPLLTPELVCSSRFLTLQQHLLQTYEKITHHLHQSGQKTFVVWLHPKLKLSAGLKHNPSDDTDSWEDPTQAAFELLRTHQQFLDNSNLAKFHQTFLVGLSTSTGTTTTFVRFDGQTTSQFTDLMLDAPGQRSQSSVADLLRTQQTIDAKDSPFFYSEFNSSNVQQLGTLSPEITVTASIHKPNSEFVLNSDLLRKTIVNSKRHVICQNVNSEDGRRLLVKVSLNLRATENRLPQLTYEEVEKDNLPSPEIQMSLQECLKNARELLTESVSKDVSLRDSSAFRTLLTGLPVKSIKTSSSNLETSGEPENDALDRSTSAVPNSPDEEQEE